MHCNFYPLIPIIRRVKSQTVEMVFNLADNNDTPAFFVQRCNLFSQYSFFLIFADVIVAKNEQKSSIVFIHNFLFLNFCFNNSHSRLYEALHSQEPF